MYLNSVRTVIGSSKILSSTFPEKAPIIVEVIFGAGNVFESALYVTGSWLFQIAFFSGATVVHFLSVAQKVPTMNLRYTRDRMMSEFPTSNIPTLPRSTVESPLDAMFLYH